MKSYISIGESVCTQYLRDAPVGTTDGINGDHDEVLAKVSGSQTLDFVIEGGTETTNSSVKLEQT